MDLEDCFVDSAFGQGLLDDLVDRLVSWVVVHWESWDVAGLVTLVLTAGHWESWACQMVTLGAAVVVEHAFQVAGDLEDYFAAGEA